MTNSASSTERHRATRAVEDGADLILESYHDDESEADRTQARRHWNPLRLEPHRLAVLFGVLFLVSLATVTGWLGFQAHQARQKAALSTEFVQVGRQEALNLTTISWQSAEADVQRILESATGVFYDEFSQRSQPFVEVVKKAQSTSMGTISAAGLQSSTDTEALVLVAVSVKTTNVEAPQEGQRAWRMRLTVQRIGDEMKVSNVEFVP